MLPQKLDWSLAQTQWAQQLNPLIKNQLTQGILLSNISLINGVTVINHLLGRNQIGFIITDINAAATIFRSQALNSKTLTLTSNAACIISLWVF